MSVKAAEQQRGSAWPVQRIATRVGLAKSEFVLLAAITALAAALRFVTLGVQSYGFDEAVTVDLVRRSLPGMLDALPDSESTPPLYYVFAWGWSKAFGKSASELRALSALFGTATVPAAYAAASALVSRRAALIASTFVALSPILIWYSQEARAYALLTFLGTLALFFFARGLRKGTKRDVRWWGVVASLSLATHYFAIFFVAPQAVWLLIRLRGRRDSTVVVAAVAAVGLALLPLAVHQEHGGRTAWIHLFSLWGRLRETSRQFLASFYLLPHAAVIGFVVGAIVVIGLCTWVRGVDRWGGLIAFGIGAVTILLPLLLAVATHGRTHGDYFYFRNVLTAWVPLAIAAAAVFAAVKRDFVLIAGGLLVAVLLLVPTLRINLRPILQRDDWRGVNEALGSPQRGRVIALRASWLPPALRVYRPGVTSMPMSGARISEIVLVTSSASKTLPGFAQPPGFARSSRRVVQHFALVELRAATPHRLTAQGLFPRQDAAVLLDRTPPGG